MAAVFALLLIVVLLACLALTLFGLPGNWLIFAVTAVYACLKPAGSAAAIGWKPVAILFRHSRCGRDCGTVGGDRGNGQGGREPTRGGVGLVCSIVGAIVRHVRRLARSGGRVDSGRMLFAGVGGAWRGDAGRTLGRQGLEQQLADRQGGLSRPAGRNARQNLSRRADGRRCDCRVGVVGREDTGSGFRFTCRLNWKCANSLGRPLGWQLYCHPRLRGSFRGGSTTATPTMCNCRSNDCCDAKAVRCCPKTRH